MVARCGRREEPLAQLGAEFPDAVRYITTDVTEKGAPANAVRYSIEQFERLDILVNNAGATWGASIEEFPESAWDKVMDINVKGPFFLTQALLSLLEASASP